MIAHLIRTKETTALVLVVAISAICGSAIVHAQDGVQTDTNERLRACDRITDTMEKLACFDAVVKSLDQPPVAPSSSRATTETPPAPAVPNDAAVAGATSATAAPAVNDARPAAVAPPPATVSAIEPAPVPATPEEMFGLKGAKDNDVTQEKNQQTVELKSIQATIVKAWPTIDGRFEVELDNGQVWRETSRTRTMRLPKEGTPVVISRGRLGSFRMKMGNDNRLAGVRRTR